jgi:hypothetical protein
MVEPRVVDKTRLAGHYSFLDLILGKTREEKEPMLKPQLSGKVFLFVAVLLIGTMQVAEAQLVRGYVSGTVSDESNAVMPGVQVTIIRKATNTTREGLTNDVGFYRFVAIEPGDYSVEFQLPGFEARRIDKVTVTTAQEVVINQKLTVGGVSTEVSVVEAPGVELAKTTATVERTFSQRVVEDLPFQVYNGSRDVTRLALLAPTVNRAPGSNEFSANGQRSRNNSYTIDGVDNNDLSISSSMAGVIPEAVQEVQVQTTAYSAEFGRTSGAQFSAITKSGTNRYHGEVWDYYRGNWMEPLSLMNKRAGLKDTPRFVHNQFGGDLGGAIVKDRTFFFALLEGNRRREAANTNNSTNVVIPTPAGFKTLATIPLPAGQTAESRQAALAALGFLNDVHAQVKNYDNVRMVNIVPNMGPGQPSVAVPVEIANVVMPIASPSNNWYNVGRVDHRLSSKDNLTYRYHLDKRDQTNVTSNLGFGSLFSADQKILRQNHALSETRVMSAHLLNEVRVAYVRSNLDFPEHDPTTATTNITGAFTIGGTNIFPQGRIEQLSELQDVATYMKGRNSFKFGADIRRNKLFGRFGTNSKGTWTFGSLAQFLFSTPTSLTQAVNESTFDVNQWHHAYFFQDDFKATSNLTLNLGMRYEYSTIPAGFFGATDPAVQAVGVRGPAQPDTNNWAPRVGFAYSPSASGGLLAKMFGEGKTSIRGGFGMSYDVLFYNVVASAASNYPRVVTQNTTGAAIANQYPALAPKVATVPPLNPANAFTNTPEEVQSPTTNFWNLSLQRELASTYIIEVGYSGSRSYHQLRLRYANPGVLNADQAERVLASGRPNDANVTRLNPAWGSRNLLETSANAEYNAGYVKFDKRMSKGLLVGANYTFSANFSDNDEAYTLTDVSPWSPQTPQDFFNLRNEWSRSVFDRPHRFTIHYTYEIPWFSFGPEALRDVLGGWQASGATEYQSGQVFTITTGADTVGSLVPSSFPGRPNYNPNGIFANDPVTGDLRTFNTPLDGTGIVVAPMANNLILANSMPGGGNLGRNTFRGPSFQNWNFSLSKKIQVREGWQLQLRSDFVNMWNHNNFRPADSRMSSPTFGQNVAPLLTDSREMMFSAKMRF